MLKGFVSGSLALIALYVIVQDGPSKKLGIASNALVAGARRLFDPAVAGIGDHSGFTKSLTPIPGAGGGGGGGGTPKFTNAFGVNGINGATHVALN